jgi:hypothetical protein
VKPPYQGQDRVALPGAKGGYILPELGQAAGCFEEVLPLQLG